MESHRLAFPFHSWLLILVISTTTALASNPYVGPQLSARPPTWLVRKGGNASSTPSTDDNQTIGFVYDQTIDHFSFRPQSFHKFKQRLVINKKYWGGAKSNSPIFVHLGAQKPIGVDVATAEILFENAPKFNAMIVFIEHRFYGKSIPYGLTAKEAIKDTEIRGCMSTSQALADYAEVISFLKHEFSADLSPVVVFGASYGGMLATWFRLKYPHIAMGALASSAPVLDHFTSPNEFYDHVAKDYWVTSKSCYKTIKQSFDEIARVASQPNGLAKLTKRFNFCRKLKSVSDINLYLRRTLSKMALRDNPPHFVEDTCKAIEGVKEDAYILDKLLAGLNAYSLNSTDCNNQNGAEYDEDVNVAYDWENCMELAVGRGVGKNSLFPALEFNRVSFAKNCARQYRVPSRAPYWFTQNYGGKHIKLELRRFGSNIIFTNGIRDPLSASGVLEDISATIVALVHPGANYADFGFSDKTDPEWLTKLRKKEMSIIQEWLSTYYADLRALNLAH